MNDLGKRAKAIGLTAKQIAEESGLVPPTVGRVLKGQGDHLESTIGKVRAAIERHERERLSQLAIRVAGAGACHA